MKLWIILIAGLLVAPSFVGADEVVLKNGDKLTGKVVGMAGGKLAFETGHSGVLKIDWGQVASLKTDEKVKVRLATKEVVEGKLSAGENGLLKVQSEGAAQPVSVEFAKVTHLNEPPVEWHGFLEIAGRATDGNTHTQGLVAQAEGVRATEVDQFTLRAIYRYGAKSGELQDQNAFGLAKYQYFLYEGLYAFTSAEFFHDHFKDLRLRTVIAAGAGYLIAKDAWILHDLSVEAGIAYIDQNFIDAQDESHMGARIAAHARIDLPLGLEVVDDIVFYPNFKHNSDWQMHNEAALATGLGKGWAFRIGVITDYDNRTPIDIERRDDIYFAGLAYRF
jgi:putative salt-induced outer membrane protein YdiY